MHRIIHRTVASAVVAASLLGLAALPTSAAPAPPDDGVAVDKGPDDVATRPAGTDLRTTGRPSHGDPLQVVERERPDRTGRNDELDDAQRIRRIGTDRRHQDALITGHLADVAEPAVVIPTAEDDGSIPQANPTGLSLDRPAVVASAVIGDGPHGTIEGDGSGDFDFYRIDDAAAGQLLTVDIDAFALGEQLDAVVAVVAPTGQILAFNDDSPEIDSFLQFEIPADGDYLVAVAAFGSLPTNPFDSASGTGARSEAAYDVTMSFEFAEDVDVYRIDLRPGDVVGAALQGGGRVVELLDPSGTLVMGNGFNRSVNYPSATPFAVGGNAVVDHVAAVAGPHHLRVSRGLGEYQVDLRVRRPGLESDAPGSRQTIFLDFDGAFVEAGTFGEGTGGNDLSPLADFIAGWGLTPDDESALIDEIIARFTENVVEDPHASGLNERFDIEVLNSRDHADPWGQPNVSRIVIGGTREQVGFNSVGIAESIDPGNFAREETGLVMLDQASAPAGSGLRTINDFITPETDVIGFVGSVLGFVASHEAGHYLGLWHTQPNNGVISIMDTFDVTQIGLGPDLLFGTDDDVDVDFVVDRLNEHIGEEDTMNRIAHALSSPRRRS